MFKLFKHKTTKADVIMAIAGAIVAGWKAIDTVHDYKTEKDSEKEEGK